ncbi:hypothetical protein HDZ31DRAFT_5903, partial [Schizophyllum fasciatum]
VGTVRGERKAVITHLIGGGPGNRIPECKHATAEAKELARDLRRGDGPDKIPSNASAAMKLKRKALPYDVEEDADPSKKHKTGDGNSQLKLRVFKSVDAPFSPAEARALRAKALRVTVDCNLPFRVWDNIEFLEFLSDLRKDAPRIMPSAKVMSGPLLKKTADHVKKDMVKASTDGWKSRTKDALNAVCVNVDYKVHTLELIDATSMDKTGEAQCKLFENMIDKVEDDYACQVFYLVTDADGGSSKGRKLLVVSRPHIIAPDCWGHQGQLMLGDYFRVYELAAETAQSATELIGWINNHSKVRKIFDAAQAEVSREKPGGIPVVLSYLVANITRWTTHVVAFIRFIGLRESLMLAVLRSRAKIIDAQVGAAKSTEKDRLEAEAGRMCDLITDAMFWNRLELVVGDLEAICYGININQKDSARADQVLLMIAGIYLQFEAHPEPEVRVKMLERLEKRWNNADQPLFLLALILNPFEGLSRFGPHAGLDHLTCHSIFVKFYRRVTNRPDNADTPATRQVKEKQICRLFLQYLAGTHKFSSWRDMRELFEDV